MKTKKTTPKKPVAKKAKTKKPQAQARTKAKATAKKKSANAKKPQAKSSTAKNAQALKSLAMMPTLKASGAQASSLATRRPTPNPPLSEENLIIINNAFAGIRALLEEASANIRPLDRARLNGVGIKKQGFIERAYAAAFENQQFMPPYLSIEKFRDDFQYFVNLNTLTEACSQLREFIWNLTIQGADITYTDALEFYASIREASQRRIDGSETIFRDLSPFFSRPSRTSEDGEAAPTKKKTKRDVNALLDGKRDGKIVIENIKPKATGGVRKVIDERFSDSAQFRETEEGEIRE
jgi:hypothetical protein